MFKFLNGNLILFSILFLGSFLRIYNINFDDLWYDEILSFWIASPEHSISESFEIHNKTDPNTFSFNFLLKIFYNIFSYNSDYARYLSAFFGILSILISIKIAKLLDINQIKNFLVLLLAFNIFLISYSQEARVYSILFFFSFLSFIYFIKIFKIDAKKRDFFLFSIFTLIAIYLHPFAFIILFSYLVFLMLKYFRSKEYFKKINLSLIAVIIFSLLFYLYYFYSLNITHDRHYWISHPDISFYTNFFFSNFFGSRIMGAIFLLSLLILTINQKKLFKQTDIIIVFFITIFLSYFLPIIFGYIYKPVLISRYIIFVLIPILVIITFFTSKILNKKIKNFLIIFLTISTIFNHFTEQTFKQFFNERVTTKPQYTKAVSYINETKFHYYFIKVENMMSDIDSINAINNYISYLNKNFPNKLILLNNEEKEKIKKPFWHFCPQDINKKSCQPTIKSEYEVISEKNFNNINLKLIRLL